MKLFDLKRISKPAAHSAFTDLIENPFDESRKTLLCCYRQATNHISADGLLMVLTVDKKTLRVLARIRIQEHNADLRDPKFSFDGKHSHNSLLSLTFSLSNSFSLLKVFRPKTFP